MSNSALISYVNRQSGFMNHRTGFGVVKNIMIHSAFTKCTCKEIAKMINGGLETSFHYGIADDGTVGLFIDEVYRAWGCGDPDVDDQTIHIILSNSSGSPSYEISDKCYKMLLELCTDICRRNFIKNLRYTGDPNTSNLLIHSWYKDTSCPGNYVISKLYEICREVNDRLSRPLYASSESAAARSQNSIIVDAISPYMVTLSPDLSNVDALSFKAMKVIGCMVYAHSPYLANQISALNSCGIPFGICLQHYDMSLPLLREALEQTYFIISKYPPKLGIWLESNFGSTVQINNAILSLYCSYTLRWGLKSKTGLRCSRSALSRIDWDSYCTLMSLWLIEEQSDLSMIGALAGPGNFKI